MSFYVVFEGIDGAGKTTQAQLLYEYLQKKNHRVFMFHEPAHKDVKNLIYKMIKEKKGVYSKETISLAFALDRYMYVDETLRQVIEGKDYDVIIGDRSFYSSIVYQYAMGVDLEWLKSINKYVIVPDLTIILDIGVKEFLERRGESEIVFENISFQERISGIYKELKTIFPEHNICYVDGSQSIADVHDVVVSVVEKYFRG